jgi:hypothetical protein
MREYHEILTRGKKTGSWQYGALRPWARFLAWFDRTIQNPLKMDSPIKSGNDGLYRWRKAGALRPLSPFSGFSLFFAREQCLGRKEARPALRKMSLMEKDSRREARAKGKEGRAERALGNRLGSEQKRPSFGYFSLAGKKSSPGVRGWNAPPRSSEHLGVRGAERPAWISPPD